VTAASVAPNGSSVTINTPSFLTGQYTGSYAAVINNVGAGGTSSAVAAADRTDWQRCAVPASDL